MDRLTVDTDLIFCDIAQCSSTPGGSFCEDGYCDQRRCYERLRKYERTGLEPEEIETILDKYGCGFTARTAFMDELKSYHDIGPIEEFRALKEAEQQRRKADGKLLNPAGEYAVKFAENHGMSIADAMEQPMVKARFTFFADTGM